MDPLEEAALQQMIKYSFVGGSQKVRQDLNAFIAMTGADEIMVRTSVFSQEARLKSYSILKA